MRRAACGKMVASAGSIFEKPKVFNSRGGRETAARSAAFTPLHRSTSQGPRKSLEPHVICRVKRVNAALLYDLVRRSRISPSIRARHAYTHTRIILID